MFQYMYIVKKKGESHSNPGVNVAPRTFTLKSEEPVRGVVFTLDVKIARHSGLTRTLKSEIICYCVRLFPTAYQTVHPAAMCTDNIDSSSLVVNIEQQLQKRHCSFRVSCIFKQYCRPAKEF